MTYHAVLWMDHHEAHVLQFDPDHVEAQRIKARTHHARQHGDDGHLERAFHDQVAQALAGVREVLIVGPGLAGKAFRKHCEQHHAAVARAVVDVQSADHPSDEQLVALARRYFVRHDRMAGTPTA